MIKKVRLKPDFFKFDGCELKAAWYMQAAEAHQAFDGFSLPAFKGVQWIDLDSRILSITGPNFCGKSTLVRKLDYHTGLFRHQREQPQDELPKMPDYFEVVDDDSYVCCIGPTEQPKVSVYHEQDTRAQQSSGQYDWNFYYDFITNHLHDGTTYAFDQPDANMDPINQVLLARLINDAAAKRNLQFLVITHSPVMISELGGRVLSFYDCPIKTYDARDFDLLVRTRHYMELIKQRPGR